MKVCYGQVNNFDYQIPKFNDKFDSVWKKTFGQSTTVAMEQNLINHDLGLKDANVKITKKKSHKCNQCDYAASQAGDLKRHLKIHSGEKSNKCNQCD